MNLNTDHILLLTIVVVLFMLINPAKEEHTYLVERLDGKLQRYTFDTPHKKGDTVQISDKFDGADGPIFLPVTAVIKDTIL